MTTRAPRSCIRIRTVTRAKLDRIAGVNRWSLAETVDACADHLLKSLDQASAPVSPAAADQADNEPSSIHESKPTPRHANGHAGLNADRRRTRLPRRDAVAA